MNADGNNIGMASVIDSSSGTAVFHVFKENSVRRAAQKIMMAEEPGSSASSDSPTGTFINDGRWVPNEDPLTIRHSGKADVGFVDAHVEAVTPAFGSDTNNTWP